MNHCNHDDCAYKRKSWLKGTKDLDLHTDELRSYLRRGIDLDWSGHVTDREIKRKITSIESTEALLNGECIWYATIQNDTRGKTHHWIWMGYSKIGKAQYRPLHLVLSAPYTTNIERVSVLTVYDPSISPWMWNKTFDIKLCWHKQRL
ncbi:hypothetical protein AAC03nite_38000 [Alicyclobacillus acidoterrestris]|nr:hypothetical protein AAC03nite_38000 [Alicyclobacillus acidoterrestris]